MDTTQMHEVRFDWYVRAAATGDREAFAHLIDATRTLVSSIAFAIVRDLDLSRDIAQDVFLTAWCDLGKLRNPVSFLPWLRQLTRRRAHEVARHRRWQRSACRDRGGGARAACGGGGSAAGCRRAADGAR